MVKRLHIDLQTELAWANEFAKLPMGEQQRQLWRELTPALRPYVCAGILGTAAVKHPMLWEPIGVHMRPETINALYFERMALQREYIAKGNWALAAHMVADPHRFQWVVDYQKRMPHLAYRECLAYAWTLTEFPYQIGKVTAIKAFKLAGWMTDVTGDANDDDAPPCPSIPVTLYRGCGGQRARTGLSWTADPEQAEFFANRWKGDKGEPIIFKATVEPWRLLAYFGQRGEAEYVVNTRGLDRHMERVL